jgi:CheY-like chemotaxis protein
MTDMQVDSYVEMLNSFVEEYPKDEEKLKSAMEIADIESVIRHLTKIRETLVRIYADELADECWTRINSFDKERPEKIEAFVVFFLSELAALSIDIQMAFLKEDDESTLDDESTEEIITGQCILAVDDDTFFLDSFKSVLKDVPCKIIGVTSGADALEVLKSITPDLFALDIQMPEMDGIELATKIRALGYSAPIIFITGNATKEYVKKCISAGASDFIIKPINPQNVNSRIVKYLR